MTQDSLFGFKPVARTGDPDTSHAAAKSVRNLTNKQEAVLTLFQGYGPMTDETMRVKYLASGHRGPQSESGLRTRRSELVRKGLVKDSGERVKLASGRMAIVWEAT